MTDLSTPAQVMERLADIEGDLARRQNGYESAAEDWFKAKREIEKARATALLAAEERFVAEKRAHADLAAATAEGAEHEAEYEAIRAVMRVLETRATICMSLLKAQGRA